MGGAAGSQPETPLSKVMPSLVTIPRQVVTTALNLTGTIPIAAQLIVIAALLKPKHPDNSLTSSLLGLQASCWLVLPPLALLRV